jgi:hypothetical protein
MDNPKAQPAAQPTNQKKNPAEWLAGEETMTGAQSSYLKTLCEQATRNSSRI